MATAQADANVRPVVTYLEAAAMLGITYDGVRQAVQAGRLHPFRIAGDKRKFLKRSEVEAYRNREIPPVWNDPEPQTGAKHDTEAERVREWRMTPDQFTRTFNDAMGRIAHEVRNMYSELLRTVAPGLSPSEREQAVASLIGAMSSGMPHISEGLAIASQELVQKGSLSSETASRLGASTTDAMLAGFRSTDDPITEADLSYAQKAGRLAAEYARELYGANDSNDKR